MNHKQLQYFMEVAEIGSITMAANRLYISQPALSKCISNLEQEIGFSLFIRGAQGVTMTDAGSVFLSGLTRSLEIYGESLSKARIVAAGVSDDISIFYS